MEDIRLIFVWWRCIKLLESTVSKQPRGRDRSAVRYVQLHYTVPQYDWLHALFLNIQKKQRKREGQHVLNQPSMCLFFLIVPFDSRDVEKELGKKKTSSKWLRRVFLTCFIAAFLPGNQTVNHRRPYVTVEGITRVREALWPSDTVPLGPPFYSQTPFRRHSPVRHSPAIN